MLFSLKNTVFTVFSCIIQNPIVSVWYYHMPFFSNVETQVPREYTENRRRWPELNCRVSGSMSPSISRTYNSPPTLIGLSDSLSFTFLVFMANQSCNKTRLGVCTFSPLILALWTSMAAPQINFFWSICRDLNACHLNMRFLYSTIKYSTVQ